MAPSPNNYLPCPDSEGVILTDEQVNEMPYLERIKWINKNPALVTLYIYVKLLIITSFYICK